ncbi:LolA-like protein [Sphaerimonospora thailandensis]|uniref:Putative lipoprotein n=1 Tax=Sphaerimonospora thailandensis TaxID=795644 RepID=A0A8J3R7T0_9ACTN|nr:LppX_LprAFG lipoprotein [Sphaerimonospora thailandensis]GIH69614.1 putative lipoprotein [Sphaerimonospora thailandensis]
MRRLLVAACAAAAITIAGCGSTTTPTLENAKLSAAAVLTQSAKKADEVTSYSADLVMDITAGAQGKGNIQGTMLYQKTPELATDTTLDKVSFAGQDLPGGMRVILLGDVMYMKMDMLKALTGSTKPWVKVDLKQIGSSAGVNVDQLLGQSKQMDLKTSVTMLTASKDVKEVGAEQVGGVDTTHYAGTFPIEEAIKQLPAEAQKNMKGQLPAEVKDMKFDAWIDGDGLPRKVQLSGEQKEGAFAATMIFKAFNEPVEIKAPPADQVGDLPQNLPVGG